MLYWAGWRSQSNRSRVVKARDLLMTFVDGGIYDPEEGLTNYTSLALMVLARLPDVDESVIQGTELYLGLQNTSGGINDGGIGYGSKGPGNEDLSIRVTQLKH